MNKAERYEQVVVVMTVRYGEVVVYFSAPERPNKHGGIEWFKEVVFVPHKAKKHWSRRGGGGIRNVSPKGRGRTGPPIDPCRSGFCFCAYALIHAKEQTEANME